MSSATKAIQQIMLGTVTNSAQQATETLQLVKQAGYTGIELCSFMIKPTSFLVKSMTKAAGMPVGNGGKLNWESLIKNSGLEVVSIHENLGAIEENCDEVLLNAQKFATKTIVITGMYRYDYTTESSVKQLAQRLNTAGEALLKSEIRLLYHNHNCEFLKLANGKTGFEVLVSETDPRFVNFEFDSYWATDIGADPLHIMQGLGERLKLYHINDRGARQIGKCMTPILKADSMELGTGSMSLEPLIKTALNAKVSAIVLESHRNWIDKSPIKSMQLSAQYLNRYL